MSAGAIDYCLSVLMKFTVCGISEPGRDVPFSSISPELLPPVAPLFDRRMVKADVEDIFRWRFELLAETALKLPYQVNFYFLSAHLLG